MTSSDISFDVAPQTPTVVDIDRDATLEESPEYVEEIDNYLRKQEVRS